MEYVDNYFGNAFLKEEGRVSEGFVYFCFEIIVDPQGIAKIQILCTLKPVYGNHSILLNYSRISKLGN